jgi:hypothetical protein
VAHLDVQQFSRRGQRPHRLPAATRLLSAASRIDQHAHVQLVQRQQAEHRLFQQAV